DGFYYRPSSLESMVKAIERALDSNNWVPKWNPSIHTWQARVETWLNWITEGDLNKDSKISNKFK
ncbi:hypothetical protein, partial [Nostoc sp.]